MECLLNAILDAFEELEICDGLVFLCNCHGCTWAHWPEETVNLWLKHRIIQKDVVDSTCPGHVRYRIDVGILAYCALVVCTDILKTDSSLYERVPRLIWRIIEIGKKEKKIRERMRCYSQNIVMQWFCEWIDGSFPPDTRYNVLDGWATSLLRTKMLALKEKQNGPPQGNTGYDTCTS